MASGHSNVTELPVSAGMKSMERQLRIHPEVLYNAWRVER